MLKRFPADSSDFVEVILHTTTTTMNTFGCLSSPQFSSCYSFSRTTLLAPEMPTLKIARQAEEPKWFALEFFPLGDEGFSCRKLGFAMASWCFHHLWKRLSFWYFVPQSLVKTLHLLKSRSENGS